MDVILAAFLAGFGLILQVESSPPYVLENDDWNSDASIRPLPSIDSRSPPSMPLPADEFGSDGWNSNEHGRPRISIDSLSHPIFPSPMPPPADKFEPDDLDLSNQNLASQGSSFSAEHQVVLPERCDFVYSGSCYTIIIDMAHMTLGEAEETCRGVGGKLADVYSEEHFNLFRALMRSRTPIAYGHVHVWTAMALDTSNRRVKLSDGNWAPYVRWFPDRPYDPPRPYIGLRVTYDNNSKYQGFIDNYDTTMFLGCACRL